MLTWRRRQAPAPDPLPRLRTGSLGWLLTIEALYQRFRHEAEEPDTPAFRRTFLVTEGSRLEFRRRVWWPCQHSADGWQIPAQPSPSR